MEQSCDVRRDGESAMEAPKDLVLGDTVGLHMHGDASYVETLVLSKWIGLDVKILATATQCLPSPLFGRYRI